MPNNLVISIIAPTDEEQSTLIDVLNFLKVEYSISIGNKDADAKD